MSKVRILVVEDDSLVAESIVVTLKQHAIEVTGVCDSGETAIQCVKDCEPDLILMDIKLSGKMDGIETAKSINLRFSIPIIYLSDYTDEVTIDKAKRTFPVNYLSKPFNEAELVRAIEIAFFNSNSPNKDQGALLQDHVFIKDSQSFVKFSFDEILCLKAGRSYCEVITDGKKFTLSTSLNHIHDQLDNKKFVRVHKSWVVNANRITKIEGNTIYLEKLEVLIGRGFRDDLINRLKLVK